MKSCQLYTPSSWKTIVILYLTLITVILIASLLRLIILYYLKKTGNFEVTESIHKEDSCVKVFVKKFQKNACKNICYNSSCNKNFSNKNTSSKFSMFSSFFSFIKNSKPHEEFKKKGEIENEIFKSNIQSSKNVVRRKKPLSNEQLDYNLETNINEQKKCKSNNNNENHNNNNSNNTNNNSSSNEESYVGHILNCSNNNDAKHCYGCGDNIRKVYYTKKNFINNDFDGMSDFEPLGRLDYKRPNKKKEEYSFKYKRFFTRVSDEKAEKARKEMFEFEKIKNKKLKPYFVNAITKKSLKRKMSSSSLDRSMGNKSRNNKRDEGSVSASGDNKSSSAFVDKAETLGRVCGIECNKINVLAFIMHLVHHWEAIFTTQLLMITLALSYSEIFTVFSLVLTMITLGIALKLSSYFSHSNGVGSFTRFESTLISNIPLFMSETSYTRKCGKVMSQACFIGFLCFVIFFSYIYTYFNHLFLSYLVSHEWAKEEINTLFCCNFTHSNQNMALCLCEFFALAFSLAISRCINNGSTVVYETIIRLVAFYLFTYSCNTVRWIYASPFPSLVMLSVCEDTHTFIYHFIPSIICLFIFLKTHPQVKIENRPRVVVQKRFECKESSASPSCCPTSQSSENFCEDLCDGDKIKDNNWKYASPHIDKNNIHVDLECCDDVRRHILDTYEINNPNYPMTPIYCDDYNCFECHKNNELKGLNEIKARFCQQNNSNKLNSDDNLKSSSKLSKNPKVEARLSELRKKFKNTKEDVETEKNPNRKPSKNEIGLNKHQSDIFNLKIPIQTKSNKNNIVKKESKKEIEKLMKNAKEKEYVGNVEKRPRNSQKVDSPLPFSEHSLPSSSQNSISIISQKAVFKKPQTEKLPSLNKSQSILTQDTFENSSVGEKYSIKNQEIRPESKNSKQENLKKSSKKEAVFSTLSSSAPSYPTNREVTNFNKFSEKSQKKNRSSKENIQNSNNNITRSSIEKEISKRSFKKSNYKLSHYSSTSVDIEEHNGDETENDACDEFRSELDQILDANKNSNANGDFFEPKSGDIHDKTHCDKDTLGSVATTEALNKNKSNTTFDSDSIEFSPDSLEESLMRNMNNNNKVCNENNSSSNSSSYYDNNACHSKIGNYKPHLEFDCCRSGHLDKTLSKDFPECYFNSVNDYSYDDDYEKDF